MRGPGSVGDLGFTLIEVLIVIAIVAVLAAVLVPAVKFSLDRAKDTKCLSHLRQIGVAQKLYATDNNDQIAPAFSASSNPVSWQTRLDPYLNLAPNTLRSTRAWQCPRFLDIPGTFNRPSYVANYNFTVFTAPTRFIQLPQGRKLVLVMENHNINTDWFNQTTLSGLSASQLSQVFRHRGVTPEAGTSRVLWSDLSISDATFEELQANRFDRRSSLWIY